MISGSPRMPPPTVSSRQKVVEFLTDAWNGSNIPTCEEYKLLGGGTPNWGRFPF